MKFVLIGLVKMILFPVFLFAVIVTLVEHLGGAEDGEDYLLNTFILWYINDKEDE